MNQSNPQTLLLCGLSGSSEAQLLQGLSSEGAATGSDCQCSCWTPIVPALFRKIRIIGATIAACLPCDYVYQTIYSLLVKIGCIKECAGEIYSYQIPLTDIRTIARLADARALRTEVVNFGPSFAQIFEAGSPVLIVGAGESKELPSNGFFLIEAVSDESGATIQISTERRCDCGDPSMGYGSETPIGGNLL